MCSQGAAGGVAGEIWRSELQVECPDWRGAQRQSVLEDGRTYNSFCEFGRVDCSDCSRSPNTSCQFSIWVRGTPGAQGLLVVVRRDDRGAWIDATSESFVYSNEWHQYFLRTETPDNCAYIVARMDIRTPGTAWVDDASLTQQMAGQIGVDVLGGLIKQN